MARVASARRVLAKAQDSLLRQIEQTHIGDTTGLDLTAEQHDAVEAYVHEHFKMWATSWVTPYIAQAIDFIDGKDVPWGEDLSRD